MNKAIKTTLISVIAVVLLLSLKSEIQAVLGIGILSDNVTISKKIRPGGKLKIPSALEVINAGDESTDFTVHIASLDGQSELVPEESWFILEPQKFQLDDGETQKVDVTIDLPYSALMGDYQVYLEVSAQKPEDWEPVTFEDLIYADNVIYAGGTLKFGVVPGGLFGWVQYYAAYVWNVYAPWSHYIVYALGVCLASLGGLWAWKKFGKREKLLKVTKGQMK